MRKLKNFIRNLWNDEEGQGMAEYVLLIVVILGVAMLFKDKIRNMVQGKLESVGTEMQGFSSQ